MYQNAVQPYLDEYFKRQKNNKVQKIIEYSVYGGKYIRGFIVKHIIEILTGQKASQFEPIVCVELIHAASLVIDDLPCMDNSIMRRDKLSTFAKFGKNEALLLSFYMVSESIRLINNAISKSMPENFTILVDEWCKLLGRNLVVGQLLDLKCDAAEYFNIEPNVDISEKIILCKTCSLFSFVFVIGGLFAQKNDVNIEHFKSMGKHFGMMYQLVDDYLDMKEDDPYANFVLQHGIEKTLIKYIYSKMEFIKLLTQYNLYTPEFKQLIDSLDSKLKINKSAEELS